MSTTYPGAVDSLTNPTASDDLSTPVGGADHPTQHANLNDAMEAVQTFVGPTGAVAGPATLVGRIKTLEGAGASFNPATVQGFQGWSFDPIPAGAAVTPTAGTLYVAKLYIPAGTITTVHLYQSNGAVSPSTFYVALYANAAGGALIKQSADVAFLGANGMKSLNLGSQAVAGGLYYVGFWFTGGGVPQFLSGTNGSGLQVANANTGTAPRFATANTGLTTTAPATLGTLTGLTTQLWVAVS